MPRGFTRPSLALCSASGPAGATIGCLAACFAARSASF
jgi:hypothetical protein